MGTTLRETRTPSTKRTYLPMRASHPDKDEQCPCAPLMVVGDALHGHDDGRGHASHHGGHRDRLGHHGRQGSHRKQAYLAARPAPQRRPTPPEEPQTKKKNHSFCLFCSSCSSSSAFVRSSILSACFLLMDYSRTLFYWLANGAFQVAAHPAT